jgi:hypothetical protein
MKSAMGPVPATFFCARLNMPVMISLPVHHIPILHSSYTPINFVTQLSYMAVVKIEHLLDDIFDLYAEHGTTLYAGEKISQLEHMCQAAQLAMAEGYDDEVVLAAFLHDIGHLLPVHDEHESMDGYGTVDHEKVGADYLRRQGFSERLCSLIASNCFAGKPPGTLSQCFIKQRAAC